MKLEALQWKVVKEKRPRTQSWARAHEEVGAEAGWLQRLRREGWRRRSGWVGVSASSLQALVTAEGRALGENRWVASLCSQCPEQSRLQGGGLIEGLKGK